MDNITNSFTFDNVELVSGLTDELQGAYLHKMFKIKEKPILYLTSTLYEANKMYQILQNYTEDVLFFPMDDFLTSEAIATSPEFEITRLETLNSLILDENKIVVTNLMGYLRFLPNTSLFESKQLKLEKGQDINIKNLVDELYSIGYRKETIVNKTGEVAVRGFIVDIFPLTFDNPIRIEFWGDTVESIKFFDIDSQRSFKEVNSVKISPYTEFLTTKNIEIKKQKELVNYENVVNIGSYLKKHLIVYRNFNEIIISYEKILNDIEN